MRQRTFKRHRVPPDIIRHSIRPYTRFTLSYRDVEEMLAERGLDVSYETENPSQHATLAVRHTHGPWRRLA